MKTLKITSLFIVVILISAFVYAIYLDAFKVIRLEEKRIGNFKLVGMEFKGPYSDAGKYMKIISTKLDAFKLKSDKAIGIYYNNPKFISNEECLSFIGVLIDKNEDLLKLSELETAGFKLNSIPLANSVVAYFPIKSTLSYFIGPMKVYPAFSEYLSRNHLNAEQSIEIYDWKNKQILFIMQYK